MLLKKYLFTYSLVVFIALKVVAHSGGFSERCDNVPMPTCTFSWYAMTSTDSALFVVGANGYCFTYYYKGDVSTNQAGSDTLTGIQFINNTNGFVWGKKGTLYKTTDAGLNWTNILTPSPNDITRAQFIDVNIGFIMMNNIIYKTTNGGSSWTALTLPGGITFKDFHFFDALNGQICGNNSSPSISGYLHQTTDGGTSWSQIYNDTCAFSKLYYVSNSRGYLYGTTSFVPLLLETNNTGANWSSVVSDTANWSLESDIVLFKNNPVFIKKYKTKLSGAEFLYNCPHFDDPLYGALYVPSCIYSTTMYGNPALYIVEAYRLKRYNYGETVVKQLNFSNNITPNYYNQFNVFAAGKTTRFKILVSNTGFDTIIQTNAKLRCRSPYITITDSVSTFTNITGNLSSSNSAWSIDEFEITLDSVIPNDYIAHLEFIFENRNPAKVSDDHSTFDLPLLFNPFSLISNSIIDTFTTNGYTGNSNSIVEPNETAQMTPNIKNISNHYLYSISGYLYSDFPQIHIWNNVAKPDGSGVTYNHYNIASFNPNDVYQPVGDYVLTDSFNVNYNIPVKLILKGSVTDYFDSKGCDFTEYFNVNYNWELPITINNSFSLPPDSLLPPDTLLPQTPTIVRSGYLLTSSSPTGNQWYLNGIAIAGATGQTYTATENGVYTLTATRNNHTSQPSSPVYISDIVPPTPTITQSGPTLISSSPTGNQWYLNGVLISGAVDQTYIPTQSGSYTVKVKSGVVESLPSAPVVITGINSLYNEKNIYFSISPNPNNGKFTLQYSTEENLNLEIYNTLGQLVKFHYTKENNYYSIDIIDAPIGMYYLKIIYSNTTKTIKFIRHSFN